ncbi:MAG: hypothetical protein AAFV53_13900, partial [Myxococcota bacterium]
HHGTVMHRQWEPWLRDGVEEVERPAPLQAALDYLLTAIRHVGGLDQEMLETRWGARLDPATVQALESQRFISVDDRIIRLYGDGWALVDGLTVKLAEGMSMQREEQETERTA